MNIKPKVSLEFIRFTNPADKVSFGNEVILGLTTYAKDFPNPNPPTTDLTGLNEELSAGISQAATGNIAAKKALEKKIKNWNDGFKKDAEYVDAIANGDEELIAESGYKSTRTEVVHTALPLAEDKFEIIPENEPGTFGIKSHVPGATAYFFAALPDGVTLQQDHDMLVITVEGKKLYLMVDTHPNVHFSNTETGIPLNVQVVGFNLAGMGPLSNILRARP